MAAEPLPTQVAAVDDLAVVFPTAQARASVPSSVGFDLPLNAFYFLSSWAERRIARGTGSRHLYATSEFARLGIPQDIVDLYLRRLMAELQPLLQRHGIALQPLSWPGGSGFAVVLSHDVDYLPVQPLDNARQCARTVARHLVHHRDPVDAWRSFRGWLTATLRGRDPYGCIPEIIARERALGLRSSFQVAVGHRHAADVSYRIEDDRVQRYLEVITREGFELCLHGSYRSTENPQWYVDEVELLSRTLGRPQGSRQHFLSFDYDNLFTAQEAAGIAYDMSMGYPDRPGLRAGFSFPYFPYNLREDRPYRVLQISLILMDATLRGYMGLRAVRAREVVHSCLRDLHDKGGAASVVWHPIVFGGARDPGYDELYFEMATAALRMGGMVTDGRTINEYWRKRARIYDSFLAS